MREQIRKKIKNEDLYEGCRGGVPQQLRKRQAVLPVRPARRTAGRPGRDRRDGRDDRPHRQGGTRPVRQGHGQRVELRAQGPHALPVERHADARVLPVGPRLPAPQAARRQRARSNATASRPACWKACSAAATAAWPTRSNWPGGAAHGWTAGASTSTPDRWWQALADAGIDVRRVLHQPYALDDKLPWDHVHVKYGRTTWRRSSRDPSCNCRPMAGAT